MQDAEGWASDVTLLRKQLLAVDRKLHQMRLMDRLEVMLSGCWCWQGHGLHGGWFECDIDGNHPAAASWMHFCSAAQVHSNVCMKLRPSRCGTIQFTLCISGNAQDQMRPYACHRMTSAWTPCFWSCRAGRQMSQRWRALDHLRAAKAGR